MEMMREFQTGGGTVVMITHDMRIVAEYAEFAAGALRRTPALLRRSRPVCSLSRGWSKRPGLAMPAVARVGLAPHGEPTEFRTSGC